VSLSLASSLRLPPLSKCVEGEQAC
jgi:hypothetical protein